MENPDTCKSCEKRCCHSISLTVYEYIQMTEVVGQDKMCEGDVTMFAENTLMLKGICPALTSEGCMMPTSTRPLMCKLFPWVAVPCYNPHTGETTVRFLLSVHECPNWKAFSDNYDIAIKEFENG